MLKKYTKKHVAMVIVAIAAFCFVMYFGLMLRDYNFTFNGGPHFVAKEAIPVPTGFQINNTMPGKLSVTVGSNPNADGYEVAYSRFSNMLFAKTYASSFLSNTKELGMLSKGTKYYIRVRYYKKNKANRKVNGQWAPIKSATVRG